MEIKIEGEIKLGQFLKIANLIATGGEAKIFLLDNEVLINGRVAGGRNAKISVGDVIKIKNQSFKIIDK